MINNKEYSKHQLNECKDIVYDYYYKLKDKIINLNINNKAIKEFMGIDAFSLKTYYKYNLPEFISTINNIILIVFDEISEIFNNKKNIKKCLNYFNTSNNISESNIPIKAKNNNLIYKSRFSNFQINQEYNISNKLFNTSNNLSAIKDNNLLETVKNNKSTERPEQKFKIKFNQKEKYKFDNDIKSLETNQINKLKSETKNLSFTNNLISNKYIFLKKYSSSLKEKINKKINDIKVNNKLMTEEISKKIKENIELQEVIKTKDIIINQNKRKNMEINLLTIKIRDLNEHIAKQEDIKKIIKEKELLYLNKEVTALQNLIIKIMKKDFNRHNIINNDAKYYYHKINKKNKFNTNNN